MDSVSIEAAHGSEVETALEGKLIWLRVGVLLMPRMEPFTA
jgi:hypothetical protein